VQEYLNRTEQVWGVVTNGFVLRLLRNSTLVRRQAYIEFDPGHLGGTTLSRFSRSTVCSIVPACHAAWRTRECLLEKYYAQTIEQGGRVREHLCDSVEDVSSFGQRLSRTQG
jgi:hypothetical protein